MKLSKWLRRTLIVLALVGAGVAGLYAFLQSKPGRDFAGALIESAASDEDLNIDIEGLEGSLPGAPRVAKLTLSDKTGPWLVLHDVEVDWSPLALVGGDIVAESISIGRADWLRLPASGDDTSSGGGGDIPSLAIGKLAIAIAVIAPEVAGQGGTFRIDGAADTRNLRDRATLSLQAVELGEAGARAAVEAKYDPAQDQLDLDAKIDDRAGGKLAAMLELPPDAPLSLALDSEGSLDDWRARLTAAGGTALNAAGEATIKRQGEWRELTLKLIADATAVGPESFRPLYEGHSDVALTAALSDAGAWRVTRLNAATPALTLTSPTAATIAVAVRGPTPSISPILLQACELAMKTLTLASQLSIFSSTDFRCSSSSTSRPRQNCESSSSWPARTVGMARWNAVGD